MKKIKFYNRNGILYMIANNKRISTKMPYNEANKSYVLQNAELFLKTNNKTLGEVFSDYLSFYEQNKAKSTLNQQKSIFFGVILKHFNPDIKVREISKKDIVIFHTYLLGYKSNITKSTFGVERIKSICSTLNCVLNHAVDTGIIQTNPAPKINLKNILGRNRRKTPLQAKPLSQNELNALLENTKNSICKYALTLLAYSGIRVGELMGLKWEDVDFLNDKLHIKRARNQSGEITTLKTSESNRKVLLLPPAKTALMKLKEFSKSEYLLDMSRYTLTYHFKKAARCAGIKGRVLYNTRHTYASMLLSKGVEIAFISKQLGHTNVATTARYYATYMQNNEYENELKKMFA